MKNGGFSTSYFSGNRLGSVFERKCIESWKIRLDTFVYCRDKEGHGSVCVSQSRDTALLLGVLPAPQQGCEDNTGSMAPRKKLEGLVAATITPMTPDGKINLPVIRQYVDYLVNEQNVKNVFVNGTTGEGLSLSIQERKQLAEEWMCQGKDKLDHVIIHVGALNLPECQELARHAAAIGADGIAVIAPFFFKPTNKDELVAFLQKVASEAPEVPFYYYHIPPLTGMKVRVEELLDGIKAQIPTFQGVKFSDTDLLDLAQCIHKNETGEFEFLYGVDEQLLGALAVGANGAVGSTYNYLGRQTNLMLQAFAKPDFALAQQYQFLTGEFLNFVIKLGFGVAQTKAVMTSVSGIPMGPPRLPLVAASSEFIIKAKAKLDSIVWPNGD
ncbi:N-acetylneuraminate lyase isoform X2 [Camarhynchus parvulus]|uniref:N-acetylneuraminate lyase isoform X2 n=1 Tax=Geospiza parvula TaxID=87175 RepID=UPI001237DEF6|nr:N-acetylneuraminate lyase isoform X2 [Camarhynchus parvulus]